MGNANVKGIPTEEQRDALTILRMVFNIPSLFGSAYIIQHILRSKKRRNRVFTRLMASMSLMDFMYAVVGIASSLPCPSDLPFQIFLARGNWKSCETFGFLHQMSFMATILYNAGLGLYFLVTVRYGWNEIQVRRRIEIPIHFICQGVAWSTAILALQKELYNPTSFGCRIATFPPQCEIRPGPCLRGQKAHAYNLALFLYPVLVIFVWLVLSMSMIYLALYKTDKIMERREENQDWSRVSSSGPAKRPRKISTLRKKFATQGLLYCTAFIMSWIFNLTLASITEFQPPPPDYYYSLSVLGVILSGLQGFFNACIYIRPRYLRYRLKKKEESERDNQRNNSDPDSSQNTPRLYGLSPLQAFQQALSVNALDDEDDLEKLELREQKATVSDDAPDTENAPIENKDADAK
jgi:hypothetical protein